MTTGRFGVYCKDILALTVQDIGDEIFIDIKDPENCTDEHVAHFRNLVEQRAEQDQSRPVDAIELVQRLSTFPSRGSTPSSRSTSFSATPVIDVEEEKRESWRREQESYQALIADGGQPSHPISLGYDIIDHPERYEQYKDILWFWHFGTTCYCEFDDQLRLWKSFRDWQDRVRKFYVPRKRWHEYRDRVRESQADLGSRWVLKLLEDRRQQNRLDDWNEFRAFYYHRVKTHKAAVLEAEQELSVHQKRVEEVYARVSDVIIDEKDLLRRLHEIKASQKEVADAKSAVESAEKALKAARRKKSKTGTATIAMASQQLSSAKDHLRYVSGSEEMRRLRDGLELYDARESAPRYQGWFGGIQLRCKRWETFLKWIDDQFPTIAAECGCPTTNSANTMVQASGEGNSLTRRTLRPRPPQQNISPAKSTLDPSSSSRVSKPARKSDPGPKKAMSTHALSPFTTQQLPTKKPLPPRRGKALPQRKGGQVRHIDDMKMLRSVRSARVSKAGATSRMTRPDVRRGRQSLRRGSLKVRPSHQMDQSDTDEDTTLRRSQRLKARVLGRCGSSVT